MVNSSHVHWLILTLAMLLASPVVKSNPQNTWVPQSDDTLVALVEESSYANTNSLVNLAPEKNENNFNLQITMIEDYFSRASLPGQSKLYDDAEYLINSLLDQPELDLNNEKKARLNLAQANLLQQRHHFEDANNILKLIPKSSDYYSQAQLIISRSHLIMSDFDEAENNCRQLIGFSALSLVELCLLESRLMAGDVKDSYKKLLAIEKRQPAKNQNPQINQHDAFQFWLYQLLGSAAAASFDSERAQQWFSFSLNSAPVSQWLLWSRQAFSNQEYLLIYTKLGELAEKHPALEDSLLLRLARAEKYFSFEHKPWLKYIDQRIKLRLLRQDQQHAADLAYYFIYINSNPEQAAKWANINWQTAKESEDEQLLKLAELMLNKASL